MVDTDVLTNLPGLDPATQDPGDQLAQGITGTIPYVALGREQQLRVSREEMVQEGACLCVFERAHEERAEGLLGGARGASHLIRHGFVPFVEDLLDHGLEDVLLVLELPVEEGLRDVGGGRDLLDGRLAEAVGAEDLDRRGQDPAARGVVRRAGRRGRRGDARGGAGAA